MYVLPGGIRMIKLLRIDERLIHGQIAVSWLKMFNISHVVIVNDSAAADPIQKQILSMALPQGVKLAITKVSDCEKILNDQRLEQKSVFVIVKNTEDAKGVIKKIPSIPVVNVGNVGMISTKNNSIKCTPYARLNKDDIGNLKEIEKFVPVEFQILPSESKQNINDILEKIGGYADVD